MINKRTQLNELILHKDIIFNILKTASKKS